MSPGAPGSPGSVIPEVALPVLPFPRAWGAPGAAVGWGMAVPDVVIEVVPLLPLGHREGQFPGHGSDAAAGQVSEPGLGERHTWQHRDTHTVSSAGPGSCLKSHSLGDMGTDHFPPEKQRSQA